MLQLPGARALSDFRIAKLLARLATLEPAVGALEARYLPFFDTARPLEGLDLQILQSLLTYGPRTNVASAEATSPGSPEGDTLLIVPRPGTISPWSSKATDIAPVCGLTAVRRIERGIRYRLLDTRPLGPQKLAAIAPA